MSGFNLDLSGLFGGGAFAIDPTKFNFSAYTPESNKAPVIDPVDVVSDKSPTPEVEVLEGAGTVAVTKPDPVQQAIESLRGRDLTDDFNVNIVDDMTVAPEPVAVATQPVQIPTPNLVSPPQSGVNGVVTSAAPITQPTTVTPTTTRTPFTSAASSGGRTRGVGTTGVRGEGSGNISRNTVDTSNVDVDNLTETQQDKIDAVRVQQDYDAKELMSSFEYSAPEELRQSTYDLIYGEVITPQAAEQFNAVYNSDYFNSDVDRAIETVRASGVTADETSDYEIKQMVMNNYGLSTQGYGTSETGAIEFKDGEFKYVEPWENKDAEMLAIGTATALATAGLGSALGAATGATGAIGTATTNAVASATIQQLTTGEIDPTKVALAALGGAVEGAEVADAAANSDLAGAFADFGAGSAEYAEALLAANEATATLELLTDISTGIDVVTAIEDRNLGRAFDLTAGLLDSPTLYDTVAGQLSGVIPEEYLDAATNALIRGGSTAVQGGDVSEVFQDAGNEFLINQFTTEEAIQERFGFEGQWAETATRTLSALGTDTLNGENSQDIALNGLQTFLDNAIRLIPEGEDSSSYLAEAERWWHENVEDPLQGWWQEIGDTRRALEQPFRDAYGVVTRIGGAAWDAIDLGIRALPTTKEDWQGAANFASGLIPELPDLPDLPDVPDLPDLPDIPDLPDVPDLPELPDLPDLPSVDVELTNSISNVDYFYDDSDIVRNPLLSSGNTRIQDLVSTIQSAEVGNGQKGRRGALVDDEDKRIKRSKGVLNLGLEANVS